MNMLPGSFCPVPKLGEYFSNYRQWAALLILAFRNKFLFNKNELITASQTLFNYFIWRSVLATVNIRNFITHADFALIYIGRNIALQEAGVRTWYFTDSANLGYMFHTDGGNRRRHPFWTYLNYDNLVTWNSCIADYYKEHPGSFRETHVVGCLWSDHVWEKEEARKTATFFDFSKSDNSYVLSCFDSTYSINGVTSYLEGLAFATHLLRIADENKDELIIFAQRRLPLFLIQSPNKIPAK